MRLLGFEITRQKPARESVGRRVVQTSNMIRRSFAAGKNDDLVYSFTGSHHHINTELRQSLRMIRARSRQLCMNNDYAKKFISVVKKNVIGVNGIVMQSRAIDGKGDLDTADNDEIERGWGDWGLPENCTVTGKHSWHDVELLCAASVARDGEVFVQMIDKPSAPHGFVIRIWSADYLDEQFNGKLQNGNTVCMGVEHDPDGMVVAYHLRDRHPGAYANVYPQTNYRRIPARDIIHLYLWEYPEQVRGVPWMHTAIRRLNMLGGYEEAELVAARVGASKMGFFTTQDGEAPNPSDMAPDSTEYDQRDLVEEVSPGVIETLPEGVGFESFNADHPSTAFDPFIKAALRGATAGMDAAYSSISNDLTDVNFSSIRAGVLDERETWKVLHKWLVTHLHRRVQARWLPNSVMKKQTAVPFKLIKTKYKQVHWQPRGWPWVDPLKDAKANSENLANGTETRTNILAAGGSDFKDTVDALAWEQAYAKSKGVDITPIGKQTGGEHADESDTQDD